MNISYINTGSSANSGDGDSIRAAFSKVNLNFTEISNSLTNIIDFLPTGGIIGGIGPTGPIGPIGPTGPAGSGSGNINIGNTGSLAFYEQSGDILSALTLLNVNTSTEILTINGSSPQLLIQTNVDAGAPKLKFIDYDNDQNITNIAFYKSRGSELNKLPILVGDYIGGLQFIGNSKNLNDVNLANINVRVTNTSSYTWEAAKLIFSLNDGSDQITKPFMELTSTSTLKVDSIDSLTIDTDLSVKNNFIPNLDLEFNLGAGTNKWNQAYLHTVNISNVIIFPDDTVQTTAFVPGQYDMPSRTTLTLTTPPLAPNEGIGVTYEGYPGYVLYKINTDVASWVRIYINNAAQATDSSRTEGEDPSPDAGVIAEVITTGNQSVILSPAAYGFVDPPSPNIPVYITNKSSTTTSVTVSLVIVQIEA